MSKENKKVEAYGVKGMKNVKWRKTFKSAEELNAWAEKNDAEVQGTRDVEESSLVVPTFADFVAEGRTPEQAYQKVWDALDGKEEVNSAAWTAAARAECQKKAVKFVDFMEWVEAKDFADMRESDLSEATKVKTEFKQTATSKDEKDGETIYEFSDGERTVAFKAHHTQAWNWIVLKGDRKLASKVIDAWSKNMMERHLPGSPAAKGGWKPGDPVTVSESVLTEFDPAVLEHKVSRQ